MKFIKVRLRNQDNPQRTIIYPTGYHQLSFEAADYINMAGEGDGITYVLGALDEVKNQTALNQVLASPDVEELTKEEAISLSNEREPITEVITNEAVARRLAIKATLGQELNAKELKALDPEDPEPGFGKSKNLAKKFETL